MNGTTLPRMSSDGTPGYPAPDTACIVDTITDRTLNCRSGANAIASTIVEQLGLVTIAPDQHFTRRCSPISARWSALISGMSSGTTGSIRKLRALLTTTCPAFANAASMSPATEASRPENTTFGPRPGTHDWTTRSAAAPGIAVLKRQG